MPLPGCQRITSNALRQKRFAIVIAHVAVAPREQQCSPVRTPVSTAENLTSGHEFVNAPNHPVDLAGIHEDEKPAITDHRWNAPIAIRVTPCVDLIAYGLQQ